MHPVHQLPHYWQDITQVSGRIQLTVGKLFETAGSRLLDSWQSISHCVACAKEARVQPVIGELDFAGACPDSKNA